MTENKQALLQSFLQWGLAAITLIIGTLFAIAWGTLVSADDRLDKQLAKSEVKIAFSEVVNKKEYKEIRDECDSKIRNLRIDYRADIKEIQKTLMEIKISTARIEAVLRKNNKRGP